MNQAVIYARVSSKEQEQEGFSIPAQLELLRKYAQKQGFEVLREYSEAETAKTSGREEFGQMVAFIQKRKTPVAILVEKTDRLYRNLKDFILIDDLMNDQLTVIHKVKEGKVISRDSHSSEKFFELLMMGQAKQYVDNLSEEVKKGQRQKIMAGEWAWVAPYGYKNNRAIKNIEPDPDAAPFVRRAYEIYASGHSIQATIEKLASEGYSYRPYAQKINKTKLGELLRSKIYMGEIAYKGEIYPGKFEPLVSKTLWYQVQVQFRKGNKPVEMNKQDFLFKGKVSCGECGKPLVGEYKKGGRYVYYRCSDMKKTCSQGYVSESNLLQAVTNELAKLPFTAEDAEMIRNAVKDMAQYKDNTAMDELARIEKERKRLIRNRSIAYQDRLDGIIDAAMYQEIEADCNERMLKCEENITRLRKAEDDYYRQADMLIELPELINMSWISGSYEEKKELLNFATSNLKTKNGNTSVELVSVLSGLVSGATRNEWRGGRGSNPRHPA